MTTTLTIRDEATDGSSGASWTLELPGERVTVREIIRSRVYQEVHDFNRNRGSYFRGLVQPDETEATLNGYHLGAARKAGRQIDWKRQFEKAVEAFEHNRIVLLAGDRQAESLDQEIELQPGAEVTFIKLVPLVGG